MLIDQLKTRLKQAMKAGNVTEREILRVALGEIQTIESRHSEPLGDGEAQAVLKKLVKSNEETLAATDDAEAKRTLEQENEVLRSLLPASLSVEQIVAALEPVKAAIQGAKGEGPAMGVAMKHLRGSGAEVDGKDVGVAVRRIRQ